MKVLPNVLLEALVLKILLFLQIVQLLEPNEILKKGKYGDLIRVNKCIRFNE